MPIICIDIDSLRADHVSAYGYHGNTTPNIDELAEDGVRFERAYVANSPCMPSRAALTSGRYGIANGVVTHGKRSQQMNRPANELDWAGSWTETEPERPWWTLPELFFQNRVETIGVSSFPRHPAPWFYHVWHTYVNPQEPPADDDGSWEDFQTPRAETVIDETIDALDQQDCEEFFTYVQLWDPHSPYKRSEEEVAAFRGVESPEYPTAEQIADHQSWDTWQSATFRSIGNRDDLDELVSNYDAEVHYADRHVGRLIDYLKTTGQYDESLIVVTADHGEEFGEHGLYREHWSTHDGTQRVPLIIKPPADTSVEQGSRDHLVTNVDISPTLADYYDLEPPERWQGQSLRPIVESVAADGREAIVLEHGLYMAQRAVRTDDWKFIRTYHAGMWEDVVPDCQLFDMTADPHEQDNLAYEHPDIVEELETVMLRWVENHRIDHEDPLRQVAREGPAGYLAFRDQFDGSV